MRIAVFTKKHKLCSFLRLSLVVLFFLILYPYNLTAKTVLKVGVYNNQPTVFMNENGVAKGLFIDVLEKIAIEEDWALEYVPEHFSVLFGKLQDGSIDLMPGVAFSEKRKGIIDFNAITVMANWAELYTPNDGQITSLSELEGKVLAVKAGDIHFYALKKMTESFNISCRFFEADEYETVFEMLEAHVVDVGVVNRLFGNSNSKTYNVFATPIIFNPIEMRYAAPKRTNEEVLNTIDSSLLLYKRDENSIYYQALNRYFAVDTPPILPRWFWAAMWGAMVVSLCLFSLVILFRYQVKRRTLELIRTNNQLEGQIEERKRAEEELRKIARVVEASPDAMALFDNNHFHMFVNDAYRKMVAKSDLDLSSVTIQEFFNADFMENKLAELLHSCLTGSVVQIQIVRKIASGSSSYWSMTFNPYYSTNDTIGGYVVDIRDVTEQVELGDSLKNAQKMEAIGMLAGGVAHDLNNILSGLVSYPDMLLLGRSPDDRITKSLKTIKRSGERAAAIVNDLLTLARRGVGGAVVLNLNEVVEDFVDSPEYKGMLSGKPAVEVSQELGGQLLNTCGSSIHIMKIIMNLFINAIEAMTEKGVVTIATENVFLEQDYPGYELIPAGEYATMSVGDTGVGLSSDEINKIFEPFYTRKIMGRSGTGLGMSVVWGTIKDHDGYIDIQSEPSNGSVFTLYFPTTREAIPEVEEANISHFPGEGQKVLVVDDMEEQRDLASALLNCLGYEVEVVASGEEAIEICRSKSVDLLLLDMIMPGGINGFETYEKICSINPQQKAIIASGFSDRASVERAQELGAGTYIKKPYTVDVLAKEIYLELHR